MGRLSMATKSRPCSLQLEKSQCGNGDPSQPKINKQIKLFFKKADSAGMGVQGKDAGVIRRHPSQALLWHSGLYYQQNTLPVE